MTVEQAQFMIWLTNNRHRFVTGGSSVISKDFNDIDFLVKRWEIPKEYEEAIEQFEQELFEDAEDYPPDFISLKHKHQGQELNFLLFDEDLYNRNLTATRVMKALADIHLPCLKTSKRARITLHRAVRQILLDEQNDQETEGTRDESKDSFISGSQPL